VRPRPGRQVEPQKFDGLELADSIAVDAHKWLYQPIDGSLLLYRDVDLARRTFAEAVSQSRTRPSVGPSRCARAS
jgi:glutamate/tyrosine decarboxylase-like PLP-dependent enzyme